MAPGTQEGRRAPQDKPPTPRRPDLFPRAQAPPGCRGNCVRGRHAAVPGGLARARRAPYLSVGRVPECDAQPPAAGGATQSSLLPGRRRREGTRRAWCRVCPSVVSSHPGPGCQRPLLPHPPPQTKPQTLASVPGEICREPGTVRVGCGEVSASGAEGIREGEEWGLFPLALGARPRALLSYRLLVCHARVTWDRSEASHHLHGPPSWQPLFSPFHSCIKDRAPGYL